MGGAKDWVILQKRATAYHLFSMLRYVSFLFPFGYIAVLAWNISIPWSWFDVASIIVIALLSGISYSGLGVASIMVIALLASIIDIALISYSGPGVALMIVIALLSGILFHYNCKDFWNVWMILDRRIIRDGGIKTELDAWIKYEIDKNRTEN